MGNWMIDESKLDEHQRKALNTTGNIVIQGCAGSGKTLLAVHQASKIQRKSQGSYLIVVYTKALRSFIRNGIKELKIPDTNVLYEWQFYNQKSKFGLKSMGAADYLFIDEAQDFSETDIACFQKQAKVAISFFGDSAQQIYDKKINYNSTSFADKYVPTIEGGIAGVIAQTGLPSISFVYNYRLCANIAKVAQTLLSGSNIVENCKNQGGNKPIVKKFDSPDDEIAWICALIDSQNLKDVGILVSDNSQVFGLYSHLREMGKSVGAKYTLEGDNSVDVLDFDGDINVMTYHSAKGLQFKTVFIPFCHVSGNNYWKKALYVAFTRAVDTLYITYHERISPFLNLTPDLYQIS